MSTVSTFQPARKKSGSSADAGRRMYNAWQTVRHECRLLYVVEFVIALTDNRLSSFISRRESNRPRDTSIAIARWRLLTFQFVGGCSVVEQLLSVCDGVRLSTTPAAAVTTRAHVIINVRCVDAPASFCCWSPTRSFLGFGNDRKRQLVTRATCDTIDISWRWRSDAKVPGYRKKSLRLFFRYIFMTRGGGRS